LDGRLASADRFWGLRLQLVVRDTHTLAAPTLVIGIPRKLVAGCGGLLPFLFFALALAASRSSRSFAPGRHDRLVLSVHALRARPFFLFTRYAIVALFLFTR
jgi:hypothetical protein